jgi:external thioesterase TEII
MKNSVFYKLKSGKNQQLICFPHLGGYTNSYLDLANKTNIDVEIWAANPPGHGGSNDKPIEDINSLLNLYYRELKKIIRPNCVFLGHSMGGIVAYLLINKIVDSAECSSKPKQLILSAANIPSYFIDKQYSKFSNDELIKHLMTYNGIPDEVTDKKSLLKYFLPILRADFMILESISLIDNIQPLDISVYFLWGEKDQIVPIDTVIQWSKYFLTNINLIPIKNGSHMFIRDQINIVAQKLEAII